MQRWSNLTFQWNDDRVAFTNNFASLGSRPDRRQKEQRRRDFTENLEAAAHALSLPRQTGWNEQKDGDSVGDNRADRGRE